MIELTLCVAFSRGGEQIVIRETFSGDLAIFMAVFNSKTLNLSQLQRF